MNVTMIRTQEVGGHVTSICLACNSKFSNPWTSPLDKYTSYQDSENSCGPEWVEPASSDVRILQRHEAGRTHGARPQVVSGISSMAT